MYKLPLSCCIGLLLLCCTNLSGQNVETATRTPIKMSGNIGINLGFYNAIGIAPRRDRFSYLFSANINPRLFGLDMPLSATYSQQETTFLQPFNQFGISPQYKWIKLHLGYRNLSYSPLTLNGHTFLGGGIELTPDFKFGPFKYEFSAMYGRLRRAVSAVDAAEQGTITAYQRMGYGGKLKLVSHKKNTDFISFSTFRAWDDTESIEVPLDNKGLKPQENLVLGVSGQYRLFNAWTFKADLAASALTRDLRTERINDNSQPIYFRVVNGWLPQRTSTQFRSALRSSVEYNYQQYTIGAKFNNIESGYTTLGSYFFQNDVREYALTGGLSLKENTISISGSIGLQHNNLNEEQNTRVSRLIGSFSFNHLVNDRLTYTASYTNYSSSLLVQREELSDSLNIYQISTGYTLSGNYRFDKKGRTGISLNLGHQLGNARDEYSVSETTTRFWNAAANFRTVLGLTEIALNAGLNYTLNDADAFNTATYGPVLNLSKKFLKKTLQVQLLSSYRISNQSLGEGFTVLNNRVGLNYRFWKRHVLRLSANLLTKDSKSELGTDYSELRGRMGYQIRF